MIHGQLLRASFGFLHFVRHDIEVGTRLRLRGEAHVVVDAHVLARSG